MQGLEFKIKHCQGVGQTVVGCVPVPGLRLEVDQRAEVEDGLNCEGCGFQEIQTWET